MKEGSVLDEFYSFSVYLMDKYKNIIYDQNACKDNGNLNIKIYASNPRTRGYYVCAAPYARDYSNATLAGLTTIEVFTQ